MEHAEKPSEVLARQVRVWRERRKLSAQGLADRIAEDGGSLDRLAISKIENGKRGVSLDDWLQLAYALAVPPPLLFLDLTNGSDVAIVPGAVVHPWLAWTFATGGGPPVTTDRKAKRSDEFRNAHHYIQYYEAEREAADEVHAAEQAIRAAEYADEAGVPAARQRHVEALRKLADTLDWMVEIGMEPPAKPREWVELMKELKLLKHPDAVTIFEPGTIDGV